VYKGNKKKPAAFGMICPIVYKLICLTNKI